MERENQEFFALLEAIGWSPAEAARRLFISPSNISQYKKGESRPSPTTMGLLKLILATEKPGSLTAALELSESALSKWEREVIEDLRWLHVDDRERVLNTIKAMIAGLPRREAANYKSKLGKKVFPSAEEPLTVAQKLVKAARAKQDNELGKSNSSRKASTPAKNPAGGENIIGPKMQDPVMVGQDIVDMDEIRNFSLRTPQGEAGPAKPPSHPKGRSDDHK